MATIKATLADSDADLLTGAEAALDAVYEKYFASTAKEQLILKPQIEQAARGVLRARLLLLAPGTIAVDADIREAGRIKEAIDNAANTQELVFGVARLITLLAKF
jgi:hypothetical protein